MGWSKKQAENRKKKQQERRALGLCPACGKQANGYSLCAECREKHTETQRRIRLNLKKNGLCQECGKNKVKNDQHYCDACAVKKRYERECKADGCSNIAKLNYHYCEECLGLRSFGVNSSKVYFVACSVCGFLFTSRWKAAKYCSKKCRYVAGYYNTDVKVIKKICKECGLMFETYDENIQKQYCSIKCSHRVGSRNGKHKRRLLKKKNFIEVVNIGVLFERDGECCKICGKKLNRKRTVPHPLAVTIDHVRPLSCGGEHSYRNAQLACFKCNSLKGNRVVEGGEQLRMFG